MPGDTWLVVETLRLGVGLPLIQRYQKFTNLDDAQAYYDEHVGDPLRDEIWLFDCNTLAHEPSV